MLERGGGAFQIDAMSGWDLYDEGSGTDSKVLLVEQEEFRQLASTRRNSSQCSYGAAIGEINVRVSNHPVQLSPISKITIANCALF